MMREIGEKIISLRKSKSWSRADLANAIGASESMISKYEQNANLPSIEMTLKICQVFNITSDYLIGNKRYGHFDKELMEKIEAIQNIDNETKKKIFEIIDVYIRDSNTKNFIASNISKSK